MQYILGADIGTSSSKAIAWSLNGKVLATAQHTYPTYHPRPELSEQNPDEILQGVVSTIRAIIRKQGQPLCISFSAAMHSIMAVDKRGNPLTPLLLWSDARSRTVAATLRQSREGKDIYAHTGTPVHAMSPLCKLVWWHRQERRLMKQAAHFISIKEYVLQKLSGEYLLDYSLASATGLFDSKKLQWYPPALDLAWIRPEQLSVSVSPLQTVKTLNSGLLHSTGLHNDIPLVAGASDGCLANLGSGAFHHGDLAITIGTSGAVRMTSDRFFTDRQQSLFCYLLKENEYVIGGAINNGGVVLDWFADAFAHKKPGGHTYDAFIKQAMKVAAGSNGLFFLPYLMGERSPMWDANARGAFIGINMQHTQHHFKRAMLEGICYALTGIAQTMDRQVARVRRVLLSGGFTRSPEWVQLLTDMIGRKTQASHDADASCIGAAMMGGRAAGVWKSWKEAGQYLPTGEVFHPEAANKKIYAQGALVFNQLYAPLKETFHLIAAQEEKRGKNLKSQEKSTK